MRNSAKEGAGGAKAGEKIPMIWWYTIKCRACRNTADLVYAASKDVTWLEFQQWISTAFEQGFTITDCSACNQHTVQDLIRTANKDGDEPK